eukprot:c17869_g1_i1 orf=130-2601(+)
MRRWRWRAQSSSLPRWMQGSAALHTATTLQKGSALLSRRQLQIPTGISLLRRRATERWFCQAVMSHDTFLTNESIEDTEHKSYPSGLEKNELQEALSRYGNEATSATLETESGSHDSLMEVQSLKICNILNGGGWDSKIQECLQPFVKGLCTGLVARVLNRVIDVEAAKSFFNWVAEQDGYKHSIYVYNALLMKLGLAKDFVAVWRLLDEMQREDCAPNNTTFAIIIQYYGKAGLIDQCWQTFTKAERFGVKPDAHIYTTLMRVLFDAGKLSKAKQLLGKMMECNPKLDIHTWSTVIHGLCKNKKMADAQTFMNQMLSKGCIPNVYVYNAMILGFCGSSDPKKALSMYDSMRERGCKPDTYTYNALIKCYCSLDMFAEADSLLSEMQDAGCEPNQVTFNILLKGLLEKGNTIDAAKLFSRMLKGRHVDHISYRLYAASLRRSSEISKLISLSEKLYSKYGNCNVEVCNAILQYYCEQEDLSEAPKYLDETFVKLSVPDGFSYALMVNAFCRSGDFNAATSLLSRMIRRGCNPTDINYSPVIIALCKHLKESEALQLFEEMKAKGIETGPATCQHLLQSLSDVGMVDAAIMLSQHITEKRHAINDSAVLSFVKCLSKLNRHEEAKVLLRAMAHRGCLPKSRSFKFAFASILRGEIDEVEKYFHKVMPNLISYTAMIQGSCKKGKLDKAKALLSQMKELECAPNLSCYTQLIVGLSKSKERLMQSFELFEEMLERGVVPSDALPSILMNNFCKAKQQDVIMKLGKLIISKGLTIQRSTANFLLRKDDELELKKLYFDLKDNNCLAERVATYSAKVLELDDGELTE